MFELVDNRKDIQIHAMDVSYGVAVSEYNCIRLNSLNAYN